MPTEYNIDPTFSVYGIVERTRGDHATLNHRKTMTIISHEIENATIKDNANTVIFAGFQRFSSFMPQIKRYKQLAPKAQKVWVFGVPDIIPPTIPNVTYVPLKKTDQLAKEWFMVSYGEDYFSALATEELTEWGVADGDRQFKGVWSFDLDMVSIVYEWLDRTVGHRGDLIENHTRPQWERQLLRLNRCITRIRDRVEGSNDYGIRKELESMLDVSLYPTLQHMIADGLTPATTV
jgi:hypothetical protein